MSGVKSNKLFIKYLTRGMPGVLIHARHNFFSIIDLYTGIQKVKKYIFHMMKPHLISFFVTSEAIVEKVQNILSIHIICLLRNCTYVNFY